MLVGVPKEEEAQRVVVEQRAVVELRAVVERREDVELGEVAVGQVLSYG